MGVYPLGTEVTLFFTFMRSGTPEDPTTITFTVERPNGDIDTFVFGTDLEVTHPPNPDTGVVTGYYECLYTGPIGGTYNYKVEGTGALSAVSPTYAFELLPDAIGQPQPAIVAGPCEPWIDPQDVADCCGITVGSDIAALAPAAQAATNVLFRLSARQIRGICERTVRPRPEWFCGMQVLARGYIVGIPESYMLGVRDDWRPITPSRVMLPNYPVRDITEVLIDGSVVPANEYRLDLNRFLIRMADTDGAFRIWPQTLRDDLEATEPRTMEVTYTHGVDPPVEAVMAASQLACEIYKACPGNEGVGDCAIPSRATRVTKQGITLELGALFYDRAKGRWDTGMKLVDLFLQTWNPRNLKRKPMIWSPDAPRFAQEVGVVGST